jgi:transposase-like protein
MTVGLVIRSLPQAWQAIKEMNLNPEEGETDYRQGGRQWLEGFFRDRMKDRIDRHLEEMARRAEADRRNGSYQRNLLTELGNIELQVPRTRRMSAVALVRAYARRVRQVDRMILACFVFGVSTRKVSQVMLPILGEPISAGTVSKVAKSLEEAVAAFHQRPLKDRYRVLMFDGVVLKRRTGAGSVKRVVLVALGITATGKKEVIDFRIASAGESQPSWEAFLRDLYARGLTAEATELIVTDGGKGLLAALDVVYARLPIQRCWAHKSRNVLNYVRRLDQQTIKRDLHKISHASSIRRAQSALGRFCSKWQARYPKAVKCLLADEEQLLTFFRVPQSSLWPQIRTTNAIERRFVEVRRRTRPMGVFSDRTSMDRILYAVFSYENFKQGTAAPFSCLTQNN